MPCGGPKKSPRTSSIVQIIFLFRSFEIFKDSCLHVFGKLINEHYQLGLTGPPFTETMLQFIEDIRVIKMFSHTGGYNVF